MRVGLLIAIAGFTAALAGCKDKDRAAANHEITRIQNKTEEKVQEANQEAQRKIAEARKEGRQDLAEARGEKDKDLSQVGKDDKDRSGVADKDEGKNVSGQQRASGGGVLGKDDYTDQVNSRVNKLEDRADEYKSHIDKLSGAEQDRMRKEYSSVNQELSSLKNQVKKLDKADDNNWQSLKTTIDSQLKSLESRMDKLGQSLASMGHKDSEHGTAPPKYKNK